MPLFIVRAAPSRVFAEERLKEFGAFCRQLVSFLPKECGAEVMVERFTFCIFSMSADDRNAVGTICGEAWKKAYPDDPDGLTVFAAPGDRGDISLLMKSVFLGYYGAENYQALTEELVYTLPILKERGAINAFFRQSYLFAVDDGCGFNTYVSSFGDFLVRMNVIDGAENRRKFVIFKPAAENDGDVISMNDLIDTLFPAEYSKDTLTVGIDLCWFLEGGKFDELRRFVTRLEQLRDRYIFAFRVPYLEKKSLDQVKKVLEDKMLLRTIEIPPISEGALLECTWNRLRDLGFSINASAIERLLEGMRFEKLDGRFYGFKTARMVADKAALCKAASDAEKEKQNLEVDRKVIYDTDLAALTGEVKSKKSGYEELNELIGMEKIAARIREITAQVKLSMADEKLDRPCIHMRFLGAPGTGKTTVARIIGRIFAEEGILRKGAFLEYSARSLCAEYVGQTAVRTASICRDAYGSVLFLDEAYALYEDTSHSNDYGKEALTTLISEMENHRDDMLVIMAGYTDDMETLMKGNAGLRSRMPYAIVFPNYTRDQLFDIFMLMVRKHFTYEPALEIEARRFFDSLSETYLNSKEFANARFVRNLYERTWSKGALRAALAGKKKAVLTKEDFLAASGEKEFSERLDRGKAKIGF